MTQIEARSPGPKSWLTLGVFVVLVVGGGLVIGYVTLPGEWYRSLNKPPFNPPNWVFAPVWTALYLMIAVAGWRIFLRAPRSQAMQLWWAQLALNFLWSPLFFGLQKMALALADISALTVITWALVFRAFRMDRTASLLLVPYAAWVSFASLLNASLLFLNS